MSSPLWMFSSTKLSATFPAAAAGVAASSGVAIANASTARRVGEIKRRIGVSCLGDVRGLLWQVQGRRELCRKSEIRKILGLLAAVPDLVLAQWAVQAAQGRMVVH